MLTLLQGQPVVDQAYGLYFQFNQDEQYRIWDDAHQRFLHDFATDVEAAHNKGLDEGKIEGNAEGKAEKEIEIARNMKQAGADVNFIAKMTGLSREKIEQLG